MYKIITNYVLGLGIRLNTKGFGYMIDAIAIATNHTGAKINMFKEVYDIIGNKYGDDPLNVERALRHAIQNCNDETINKMSVGTFLATIKLKGEFKNESEN